MEIFKSNGKNLWVERKGAWVELHHTGPIILRYYNITKISYFPNEGYMYFLSEGVKDVQTA